MCIYISKKTYSGLIIKQLLFKKHVHLSFQITIEYYYFLSVFKYFLIIWALKTEVRTFWYYFISFHFNVDFHST